MGALANSVLSIALAGSIALAPTQARAEAGIGPVVRVAQGVLGAGVAIFGGVIGITGGSALLEAAGIVAATAATLPVSLSLLLVVGGVAAMTFGYAILRDAWNGGPDLASSGSNAGRNDPTVLSAENRLPDARLPGVPVPGVGVTR